MKLSKKYIDDVLDLGKFIADFAKILREPHLDKYGRIESDTDHTVMLAVLACAVAAEKHPKYDLGLVAQFAIVHDLVEVYAGDVITIDPKKVDRKAKELNERAALEKIKKRFGKSFPWLHKTIEKYEELDTPEARFVKTLDKALPGLTHIWSDNVVVNTHFDNADDYAESIRANNEYYKYYSYDQEVAMNIRNSVLSRVIENKRKFHQK